MNKSGYIYLASPYTHADPWVKLARYQDACRAAAVLMKRGHVVFSPIAHSHAVETVGLDRVYSGEFWRHQDIPLLRHADKLIVLTLYGWLQSAGVAWEIELARELDIEVGFMGPEELIT